MIAALGAIVLAAAAADRPWQAHVDVGLASAVGFGGIDLAYAPSDRARIELGAGYGITGWQLSLMPRYAQRLPGFDRTRWTLGLGPSVSLKRLDPSQYASKLHRTGVGVWLNAEVGLERVYDSGLALFLAGGVTGAVYGNYLVAEDWALLTSGKYMSIAGTVSLQARFGIGWAF